MDSKSSLGMWGFKSITQREAALGEGNGKNGKTDML